MPGLAQSTTPDRAALNRNRKVTPNGGALANAKRYVQASIFLLTRNPADGSGWDFDPSQWITQRHNMDTQWILALNGLKNRAIPELPLPRACLE
ncbi:hypothetical protein BDDG_11779 [Blastomyces dermatitidis ATCC 18188]|uniref:Uncharacterized protein n=1 Tax=Ajellomyces dermatitidis (strain ATCC 18188 / CBS 674.68) TaxID=653446 RepID=A0A0J9ELB5_AJEDA|nr:hypothetical protein BDDG_11779 [Blastomyces dermatitidis ATCC 18188]